jgi:hypothetical protein
VLLNNIRQPLLQLTDTNTVYCLPEEVTLSVLLRLDKSILLLYDLTNAMAEKARTFINFTFHASQFFFGSLFLANNSDENHRVVVLLSRSSESPLSFPTIL